MTRPPETRLSLLLQLGQRSDDAWAEFLQVYERAILRYCQSLGLQEADARDATQEVLAAVHARIPTWDGEPERGSFRAWLFRVARNVAVDSIAARARRSGSGSITEIERRIGELSDPRAGVEAGLETEYRKSLFEWAASEVRQQVREATWRAFELTAVSGLSAEAAAAELGMTVGGVYTAKCRVVARIRARIEGLDGAFPAAAEARSHRTRTTEA